MIDIRIFNFRSEINIVTLVVSSVRFALLQSCPAHVFHAGCDPVGIGVCVSVRVKASSDRIP